MKSENYFDTWICTYAKKVTECEYILYWREMNRPTDRHFFPATTEFYIPLFHDKFLKHIFLCFFLLQLSNRENGSKSILVVVLGDKPKPITTFSNEMREFQ